MSQVLLEMNESSCDLDGIEPLILNPEDVAKLHECQNFLEAAKSELQEILGGANLDEEVKNTLGQILQGVEYHYDELLTITD